MSVKYGIKASGFDFFVKFVHFWNQFSVKEVSHLGKFFLRSLGAILRMRNILTSFDDFAGNELLAPRDMQDYQSRYLDLYHEMRPPKSDKEVINDDIVFEMELIRQVEINIDYILMLVAKYHDSNCEDKEILVDIRKAVDSSMQLRSKKDLIENFIATVNTATKVDEDWIKFVTEQKKTDLDTLIVEEKLKPDETRKFVDNSFRDGILKATPHNTTPTKENILGAEQGQGCALKVFARTN